MPSCQLSWPAVEDVRAAIDTVTVGVSPATAKQYLLRCKSLMTYAKSLGYTRFNAGSTHNARAEGNRGATLAKRIITETEIALLIRATRTQRDRVLVQVPYAGGLRVSEIVGLNWDDVLTRSDELIQLAILGKGGKLRNIVLPRPVKFNDGFGPLVNETPGHLVAIACAGRGPRS
jgi:site-specific recombinase XerD